MSRLAVAPLFLLACVSDPGSETGGAPLVGIDGSSDAADRNCNVVLRDLERNWTGFSWETVGSSWVWQGSVEISEAAHAEGLVPRVTYQSGSDPTWRVVTAAPSSAAPTPGFVRYTARIWEGLPGPGMSGSALESTRIQVVPYLLQSGGGRLFDHNRHSDDFDNYDITWPDMAVWSAPTICAPAAGPQRARLIFASDFSERREGVLAPGGEMTIVYDTNRLATCRHSQGGNPLWDITAHVLFLPGGERRDVSVRDTAPTIPVSATARQAVLWFENTSASGCQAWDSNFGANYTFDALVPPQWIGNAGNLLARSPSDPCDGRAPAPAGFHFDTWTRQRASATNLCFEIYQPGMTDRDDPLLWEKLDVSVRWRIAGQQQWRTRHVDFDRRAGNNARYRMSWRDHDPFRAYHCPEVAPQPNPDPSYVQLLLEYYIVVNGGELRPAPGGAYAGMFVDHANDPWRAANCP